MQFLLKWERENRANPLHPASVIAAGLWYQFRKAVQTYKHPFLYNISNYSTGGDFLYKEILPNPPAKEPSGLKRMNRDNSSALRQLDIQLITSLFLKPYPKALLSPSPAPFRHVKSSLRLRQLETSSLQEWEQESVIFLLGAESGPFQSQLLMQTFLSLLLSVIMLIGAEHVEPGRVRRGCNALVI